MKYTIELLSHPTSQDVEDINALLPQIATRPHFMPRRELQRILGQKSCRLVAARSKIGKRSSIVGMATLTLVYVPTGLIAVVEDVVVDERFRGLGIGRQLTHTLVRIASRMKAKHISLTTNPSRTAANALYQSMGFFKKNTNHYRINLRLPTPASERAIARLAAKRNALANATNAKR